jgi:hypothetical protein
MGQIPDTLLTEIYTDLKEVNWIKFGLFLPSITLFFLSIINKETQTLLLAIFYTIFVYILQQYYRMVIKDFSERLDNLKEEKEESIEDIEDDQLFKNLYEVLRAENLSLKLIVVGIFIISIAVIIIYISSLYQIYNHTIRTFRAMNGLKSYEFYLSSLLFLSQTSYPVKVLMPAIREQTRSTLKGWLIYSRDRRKKE